MSPADSTDLKDQLYDSDGNRAVAKAVLQKEKKVLQYIFDSYASTLGSLSQDAAMQMMRDFGVCPSLLPIATVSSLFISLASPADTTPNIDFNTVPSYRILHASEQTFMLTFCSIFYFLWSLPPGRLLRKLPT